MFYYMDELPDATFVISGVLATGVVIVTEKEIELNH